MISEFARNFAQGGAILRKGEGEQSFCETKFSALNASLIARRFAGPM
jgi:hypothetical protein